DVENLCASGRKCRRDHPAHRRCHRIGELMTDESPEIQADANDASIPRRGRLLGIDYGTVRVGVSVSDQFQKLASPLHNYERVSRTADQQFFQKLAKEYEVVGFVVGLPLHMNGDESTKSQEARRYGRWLKSISQRPVTFQDERLSSAQAENLLRTADFTHRQRTERIDKLAAQIVLQTWLDRRLNLSEETCGRG
ncbi:MAG: Holliday junction resolvase RuvX, partial [Planctomycetaceae bacterium]